MVQQSIKYSDGTETVINYRGKIVDGVLIPDEIINEKNMDDEKIETPVEEKEPETLAEVPEATEATE